MTGKTDYENKELQKVMVDIASGYTERIMAIGSTGTGKSYSWLKLAERFSDNTFHVLDTDRSVRRMLSTEFSRLGNVLVTDAANWDQCYDFINGLVKTEGKVKPGDWVVVDLICSIWDMVQSHFVSEIFDKGIGEYFLQARKELKQGAKTLDALKGWVDWSVMNKMYQELAHKLFYVLSAPPYLANIFVVAKATRLSSEDKQETIDMFGTYGLRPEGEKRNIFRVHTVLLMQNDKSGYYVSTIKDRGRSRWGRKKVSDFGIEYGGLAGWQ